MSRNFPNGWHPPVIVHNKPTEWQWTVLHPEALTLGNHTDIGAYTLIHAGAGCIIEDDVQIGNHCSIMTVDTISNKIGPVSIRKGAKIGMHCGIMPNVTIGENATVGAFSFVNHDIPAGETWYGVPAQYRKG